MRYHVIKLIICLLVIAPVNLLAREKTTRTHLKSKPCDNEVGVMSSDSIKVTDVMQFQEKIVVMRGYSKNAGVAKESFMLTNCSNLHLSSLEIIFRYTDMEGTLIHERTENVLCDLPPYSSRQVSIKTFDEGKMFYYYKSKSKKGAVAYDVAIRIESYNIKISR